MSETARFLGCLGLAVGLHLLVFPAASGDAAGAAGAQGANSATVARADGTLVALVAEWQRPVAEAPPVATVPEPPQAEAPSRDLPAPSPAASPSPPRTAPALAPPLLTQQDTDLDALGQLAPHRTPRPPARRLPEPVTARPAPPPTAPSAQPALRAQGDGDGAQSGANARAADAGGTGSDRRALAAWGAQIRARIERHARRGAGHGTVVLGLEVAANGALQAVTLVESSGIPALDAATLTAARNASPFTPAPAALGPGARRFRIGLTFRR